MATVSRNNIRISVTCHIDCVLLNNTTVSDATEICVVVILLDLTKTCQYNFQKYGVSAEMMRLGKLFQIRILARLVKLYFLKI